MTKINIYTKEQVDALLGNSSVTKRTASDDWTDLFDDVEENSSHYVVAKKDIFIGVDTGNNNEDCFYFIPKGFKDFTVRIDMTPFFDTINSCLIFERFGIITYTDIPDTSLTIGYKSKNLTATVVNDNVVFATTTTTSTYTKSNFVIYTR